MNNSFGKILRVTIFGASHSEELGVMLDGVPSGVSLRAEDFIHDLDRRRPQSRGETPRCEADEPIVEGVDVEGITTGERVTIKFRNSNIKSGDYSHLVSHPRPSHADLTQRVKYGSEYNLAGGGMASGRMTVALVAAGVVAKKLLTNYRFDTSLKSVGRATDESDFEQVMADARAAGDSIGGVVECRVSGVERSLGEPFFDSVESTIAHLVFSIPGVKGIEFGDGFEGAMRCGSERNDKIVDAQGTTLTNNEGGVNGGISNGNDIVLRVAIKPTPSIAQAQPTYNFEHDAIEELRIGGRHDACIARRAMVVVEAMVAFALADLRLQLYGNA
ncbi:MAG: chorismate synthase [Alistipes sp.]|nr:chorismate synthase [Alistipes sp.]